MRKEDFKWAQRFVFGALTLGAFVLYREFAKQQRQSPKVDPEIRLSDTLVSTHAISDEPESRIKLFFPTVYLTLTSIIQGVVFGGLAAVTFTNVSDLDASEWFALATCLGAIIAIWQNYMVGSTMFTWIPTILDAIIPFVMGSAQFGMIVFAVGSTQKFLLMTALTWALGALAWGNLLFHFRHQQSFFADVNFNTLLSRFGWSGFAICILGAITLAVLFSLSLVFSSGRFNLIFTACAFATAAAEIFLRSVWYWNRPLLAYLAKEPYNGR